MSDSEQAGHIPANLPPLELYPTLEEWLKSGNDPEGAICASELLVQRAPKENQIGNLWIKCRAEVMPGNKKDLSWKVLVRRDQAGCFTVLICGNITLRVGIGRGREYIRVPSRVQVAKGVEINFEDLGEWHRVMNENRSGLGEGERGGSKKKAIKEEKGDKPAKAAG